MPIYPSTPGPPSTRRHLWRHALTSAGISAPSSLSLVRFLLARRKPHRNSTCITRAFSGGPAAASSASSRLPRLLFGSAWELRRPGSGLTERGSGGCGSCLIKYMFPVLTCQARGPYCSRPRMKDKLSRRSTPSTPLIPRTNNLRGVAHIREVVKKEVWR